MIKNCPNCKHPILYQVLRNKEVPYNAKGEKIDSCPHCGKEAEVYLKR